MKFNDVVPCILLERIIILPKLGETAMTFNKQPHLVVVPSDVQATAKFMKNKDTANMGERLAAFLFVPAE